MAKHMPGPQLAEMEEHLLICEFCRKRLEESDAYVAAMRRALVGGILKLVGR